MCCCIESKKSQERKNKIIFINGLELVKKERNFSYLSEEHLDKLTLAFFEPENHSEIAKVVELEHIVLNDYNLNIGLYLASNTKTHLQLNDYIEEWKLGRSRLQENNTEFLKLLLGDEIE